jgi:Bromodomain
LLTSAFYSGRLVATNFLTLPSKKDLPDYYKVIKMPIALDTIEEKLKRREFPNLTSLESYCKRMISNAKEYNQKGSEIYDDAERIRKALSNFMTKHNPAYITPGYVAVPTPLPNDPVEEDDDAEGGEEDGEEAEEQTPDPAPSRKRTGRASRSLPSNNLANGRRSSATPSSITDTQYSSVGFQGLTFQQAQEKLIADMILYKEDEE